MALIVGSKPFGAYKSYVLNLISSGQLEKIKLMARGPKNIYKAISLAEVIKRMSGGIDSKILAKSEEREFEGKKRMVTAIEIRFGKK